MEGALVIKNVSVKLFSFFNGGGIGDQNVFAKFYSFFNGGSIGDEGLVCQTPSVSSVEAVLVIKNESVKLFQLHQWRL